MKGNAFGPGSVNPREYTLKRLNIVYDNKLSDTTDRKIHISFSVVRSICENKI